MHDTLLSTAARLSDDALLARLKDLAIRERDATMELVAHLAELLNRKAYLGQGWGSVYSYCCDVLHLSRDAAYNRVATAGAVRKFPVILDHLAAGFVSVTTVNVLRPVLTPENHLSLLAEAKYRSRREVEVIVRRIDPRPDVRSTIRKLPTPAVVAPSVPEPTLQLPSPTVMQPPPAPIPSSPIETSPLAPPAPRPVIAALSPERYRLQFTVSKETHDTLRRVQDLLCREIPDGDPALIFERALTLLLSEVEKNKLGATPRPRRPRGIKPGSRHVPAHVRRAVSKRDGAQCAFVGKSGRCPERRYLEWHHCQPFGKEGPATIENISLRCRAHNVYESELVFGPFQPGVVREHREKYGVPGKSATFRNGAEVIERTARPVVAVPPG